MDRHRTPLLAFAFAFLSLGSILFLSPRPKEERAINPFMKQEMERERARERAQVPLYERIFESDEKRKEEFGKEEGYAWDFFEYWYGMRAFPYELIPKSAYYQAWQYAQNAITPSEKQMRPLDKEMRFGWNSIGPVNIGGRMLALALDPSDPNVLWAGAASGGLWKSNTAAEGAAAWERIETGFPALSISAIAISEASPNIMYLGTGEISRYARPLNGTPGARASYGIGVLKSVDRGVTWSQTGLNWSMDQQRAVLALRVDPVDNAIVWAATSEGLYKSTDAGATWALAHSTLMAMDVVLDPQDHNKIFVSHGQLNSTPDPGIYRSTDGGATWTKLAGGLPTSNFGRTPLAIVHSTPIGQATVYAGVSDANTRQVIGLYRSTNDGNTWTNISSVNWAGGQAWYDNVIGVSPNNPNLVLCGGLDWYRSLNGGVGLSQVSYWYNGYMGVIPPGGPEGTVDYVHADQHALVFDPINPSIVYIGCDGGVFKSVNNGGSWSGKNGGLVTTQFYAGFAGGYATSGLAVGGLQDNGTVKYTGDPAWEKIFGGDGGWCAIDPTNEEIIYEEYVYLNMYKSWDGGQSWSEIMPQQSSSEANFIAPFVISESNPNVLYAGTRSVKKTTNGGTSWFYPDGNSNWNGTPMAVIGVSYTNPDTVLAGTGSGNTGAIFEIRRSTNGGANWTNVTAGLPQRYPTDISFCRTDSRYVWLVFSGYGTPHVYRSSDAGLNWEDRTGNLPDIPVQCLAVDPYSPDWVYVGTDLGVFMSLDGGSTWLGYNHQMPSAMILDLVIHPSDRKMRAATFGNGVYEIDLFDSPAGMAQETSLPGQGGVSALTSSGSWPNPFRDRTSIRFRLAEGERLRCAVYDAAGRCLRMLADGHRAAGSGEIPWDGRDDGGAGVSAGTYFIRLTAGSEVKTEKVVRVE